MIPVQNSRPTDLSSLDKINPQAFALMKFCDHRVVSVERETSSKFKIKTECRSRVKNYDDKFCEGFMQFKIKNTGTELYLGKFNHHEKCYEKNNKQPAVLEDIEMSRDDFKECWPQMINEAKSAAKAKLQRVIQDREAEESYYDVVPFSAHEMLKVSELVHSIENLESQFKAFF